MAGPKLQQSQQATHESTRGAGVIPNDTVGNLICGILNDHPVRKSLGRVTSPMAVAAYAYAALPADVHHELPDAERLTAALDGTNDEE